MTLSLMACQTAPKPTGDPPPEMVPAEAGELPEVDEDDSVADSESSGLELLDCRAEGCDPEHSCVHRSEIDCTEQCRKFGKCSVITKDAQQKVGEYLCTNWQDAVCGAMTDQDCTESNACKKSGFCKAGSFEYYYNKCSAEDEADCLVVVSNVCLVTPEGCMDSSECAEKGTCGVQSRYWGSTCRPLEEFHCQQSARCRETGECGLIVESGSWCAPTLHAHCQESKACKEHGLCVLKGSYCTRAELTPQGL